MHVCVSKLFQKKGPIAFWPRFLMNIYTLITKTKININFTKTWNYETGVTMALGGQLALLQLAWLNVYGSRFPKHRIIVYDVEILRTSSSSKSEKKPIIKVGISGVHMILVNGIGRIDKVSPKSQRPLLGNITAFVKNHFYFSGQGARADFTF